MNKIFFSGFGAYDSKLKTGGEYNKLSMHDVLQMVKEPRSKPKDQSQWAIFSTYNDFDARSHDRQREMGQFTALAGDIDTGNIPKRQIIDTIKHLLGEVSFLIYSTSGATEDNKKWRFIIPVRQNIPGARYSSIQKALFDLMADQGIECDRALTRPGQPIYLPNVPMDKRNAAAIPHFYDYEVNNAKNAIQWERSEISEREYENISNDIKREQMALEEAQKRREERQNTYGDESVVEAFNQRHSIDELLIRYQYKRNGSSDQYQSRYQSSGSFATKCFGEYWVSLSGSDAANGLGRDKDGYCAGDAFDLFVHYEHNGDFTNAVRAYGEEINPVRPTAAQVLKPILGSWDGPELKKSPPTSSDSLEGFNDGGGGATSELKNFKLHNIFSLADAQPVLQSSYLIKGWLGAGQMSVIYGPSNVGKSFFCLSMAFSIATNQEWNNCRVRGGPVLYLATEGGNAFRNRLYALKQQTGITDAPLLVRPSPIDLLRAEVDLPALSQLIEEIKGQMGSLSLIVVDTLSRAMAGGNENGPEDMTRFIGNLDALRELTGAHIMVVHHSGKDTAAGARGHSSLRAASDSEIELERKEDGLIVVTTTKQRDIEPKPPIGFTLEVERLGEDEDGDPVTTAIVKMADPEDVAASKKILLGKNERKIIECFDLIKNEGGGGGNPGGEGFPMPGVFYAIDREKVQSLFEGRVTVDRPDKAFAKALATLIEKGQMCLNRQLLWIPTKKGMI